MNPPNTIAIRPKLIAEITQYLAELPGVLGRGRSDPEWTAAIKNGVGSIGRKHDYLVCATGVREPNSREWLFDLIWFRNNADSHLREVALVLESEWLRDPLEIQYDFEKLLVAKAPIKVMIFQDYNGNLDTLWALLETGIRTFEAQDAEEIYLLAAFQEGEHKFTIRTVTASQLRLNAPALAPTSAVPPTT